MGRRRLPIAAIIALGVALLVAPPAEATFHLMSIREVYPGSAAHPDSGYVELQMYAAGQNHVGGHALTVYSAGGGAIGTFTFGSDVANGADQQTILIGDSGVQSAFGVAPDLTDPGLAISATGGAACWAGSIDCVSWGAFSGSTPSASGSPADPLGIPDGSALRRTIEPNCPTLLEAADDSDVSATDFLDASPAPRSNSVPPSEHSCPLPGSTGGGSQGSGGGGGSHTAGEAGGGRQDGSRPQTRIRRGPSHLTRRRTATFRFASSEARSTFLCGLDRQPFKACGSPYVVRHLRPGRHVLRVEARAPGGATDRTPAVWRFRVTPRR